MCFAGLAGPFLVGALKHRSGDYTIAVLVLAAVMAVGAAFAFVVLPIISPDSTLQPKGGVVASPQAGELDGDSKAAAAKNGGGGAEFSALSDHDQADARLDGGVQLVPLRSPC